MVPFICGFEPVEGNTMIATLTVLLCIGNTPPGLSLRLSTTIVQNETLPSPILWAEPGSIVSWGKSVTILCQGNIQAQEYYLNKEGRTSRLYRQTVMEPGSKAMFPILFITELYAGLYRCYYESPAGSSEYSDTLELVVTDVYSKPSLSALPSSVVTPGENVTCQCVSWLGFETFILTEEGVNKLAWTRDSQRHPRGHMQALFPMGPLSPRHRQKLRCYGSDKSNAQVWSAPSEPLELIISVDVGYEIGVNCLYYAEEWLRPPAHHQTCQNPKQAHVSKITQWRILPGSRWVAWSWWFLEFFYLRLSTARERHKMQPGGEQRRQQYPSQSGGTMTTMRSEFYKLMWFWS